MSAPPAQPQPLPLSSITSPVITQHVVLRTAVGDILLGLYSHEAPQTVSQVLKLVRAGVYDGVRIFRIEPGFVAQVGNAEDRTRPFMPGQRELIHKIPAEFSATPHVRGVLSMAREDGDPNSAQTSFSILLGPASHLDGKYTVFGRVERGQNVLDAIERVTVDPSTHIPVTRLNIYRAEVVEERQLAQLSLAPAHPQPVPAMVPGGFTSVAAGAALGPTEVTAGLSVILLLALALAFVGARLGARWQASLALLIVLVGGVLVYGMAIPAAHTSSLVGGALFLGLVALFRLMGRFEGG